MEGVLSMANAGPNSNNSQFIITTVVSSHLDGTNVVFGKVLRGLGIVKEIEKLETDANGKPIKVLSDTSFFIFVFLNYCTTLFSYYIRLV